jgi:hypothetical protein
MMTMGGEADGAGPAGAVVLADAEGGEGRRAARVDVLVDIEVDDSLAPRPGHQAAVGEGSMLSRSAPGRLARTRPGGGGPPE